MFEREMGQLARALLLGAASLSVQACVKAPGRLESNRFQHDSYPYAVFYTADGGPQEPIGPSFVVDNVIDKGAGALEPNPAPDFVVERAYDLDGDGKPDVTREEPRYDLSLRHRSKDATLFVRTVPLEQKDAGADLRTLADRYLARVSTTGKVVAPFGVETRTSTMAPTSHADLVTRSTCTVSRRPAERIDFTVRAAEGGPVRHASVVFVQSDYKQTVDIGRSAFQPADFPVLLMLGLDAGTDDPGLLERDFMHLLEQTVLGEVGKGLSMHGETTCSHSAASTSDETSGGEAPAAATSAPGTTQAPGTTSAPSTTVAPTN